MSLLLLLAYWCHVATVLPRCCYHADIMLPSCCHHAEVMLPCCHHAEFMLPSCMLPSFWSHVAIILPACWCHVAVASMLILCCNHVLRYAYVMLWPCHCCCHAATMWRSFVAPLLLTSGIPPASKREVLQQLWLRRNEVLGLFKSHQDIALECLLGSV